MPRIQINLTGTSSRPGATWTVTTQWAVSAMPTPAALTTALQNALSALRTSAPFKGSIASNYSLVTLHGIAYAGAAPPASFAVDATGAPIVGTGLALIPPLAYVVSEQTAAAGPSYRGRSYWPSGNVFDANTGNVTAGGQATTAAGWIAMHDALRAALTTMGGSPVHVVYSRKTSDMTPISNIRIGTRVDTARGRFGDQPESYTAFAVTNTLALVQGAATEPGETSSASIGDDGTMTPEELQEALDIYNAASTFGDLTLGPLKESWDFLKTVLELKNPD